MRVAVIAGLLLLGGIPAAHADIVHLTDGGRLEGSARREGDEVVVRVDGGELRLAADAVSRIEASQDPLDRLRRRRASSGPGAPARAQLARWAAREGLAAEARALWREVLELDPGHVEAHRALGHERVDGRWLDEAEARRAQGLVFVDGRWRDAGEVAAEAKALSDLVQARRDRETRSKALAAIAAAEAAAAEARAAAAEARRASEVQGGGMLWPLFSPQIGYGSSIWGPTGPGSLRLGLRTRRGGAGGQVLFGPVPAPGRPGRRPPP